MSPAGPVAHTSSSARAASPVIDRFSFVHQPLTRNGSITVRVTSLTGKYQSGDPVPVANPSAGVVSGVQPWAKVGVIIKASTDAGIALRGGDGYRQPRRPHAVRLHARPRRSARNGLQRVAALAAADPLRRHAHRLRLDRRPRLDEDRGSPHRRLGRHGAGRAFRRVPRLHGEQAAFRRIQLERRPGSRDRRLRPCQPPRRSAHRSLARRPGRRDRSRTRPAGERSRVSARRAAASRSQALATSRPAESTRIRAWGTRSSARSWQCSC